MKTYCTSKATLSALILTIGAALAVSAGPVQPVDWIALPFPIDSNWGASQGMPAEISDSEIILQGQDARTQQVYAWGVTIECDVSLEERAANDGSFDLYILPPDLPLDLTPVRFPFTKFRIIYSNTGDYGSVDRLNVEQGNGVVAGTPWTKIPFPVQAWANYHVTVRVSLSGRLRITINGQRYLIPRKGRIRYQQFQFQLGGWQPGNRWHVRNFVVR